MANPRRLLDVIKNGSKEELTLRLIQIYNNSAKANENDSVDDKLMSQLTPELKDENLDDPENYFSLSVVIAKRLMELKAISCDNDGQIKMMDFQVNPSSNEEKLDQKKYGPMWTPAEKRPAAVLTSLSGYLPVLADKYFGEKKMEEMRVRLVATLKEYQKELNKESVSSSQANTNQVILGLRC